LYTNNRSHGAANWWGPPMLLLHLPFTRAAVAQSNHHLARKCSSLICRTILVVFWAWRECSNAFWACNGRQCLASLVTGAGPSICKASACSTRQSPTSFSPPADASLRSSQVETAEYPAPRPGSPRPRNPVLQRPEWQPLQPERVAAARLQIPQRALCIWIEWPARAVPHLKLWRKQP
jgi:hypothetical protein